MKRDVTIPPAVPLRRKSPGKSGDGNGIRTSEGLTDVMLVCLFCGEKTTIRVFKERCLPGTVFWECFKCQKEGARSAFRRGAKADR